MQDVFTAIATAAAVFTVGYTLVSFAAYAWTRSGQTAPSPVPAQPAPQSPSATPPAPTPIPSASLLPDPWTLPVEPAPTSHTPIPTPPVLLLLPPAREIAPIGKPRRRRAAKTVTVPQLQVEALPDTIRELRKLCTQRGIKGAGRWSKAQCLAALV